MGTFALSLVGRDFFFNFFFINKVILRDKLGFILLVNEFWVSIFFACI